MKLTTAYESVNVKNLFFAGNSGHVITVKAHLVSSMGSDTWQMLFQMSFNFDDLDVFSAVALHVGGC